jgi:hypothetical protein
MISYVRQVAICESVREMIKRALLQGNDMGVRQKVNDIPTTESILRVVSLYPTLDTEETLKEFITNHIINSLRLTATQREQLTLNG